MFVCDWMVGRVTKIAVWGQEWAESLNNRSARTRKRPTVQKDTQIAGLLQEPSTPFWAWFFNGPYCLRTAYPRIPRLGVTAQTNDTYPVLNVLARRWAQGLTQEQFARKVGVHQTYLAEIERGERNPSLKIIYRIARAFKVRMADLMKGL
jgi:DNA-binding XRE family transcriptional regulator